MFFLNWLTTHSSSLLRSFAQTPLNSSDLAEDDVRVYVEKRVDLLRSGANLSDSSLEDLRRSVDPRISLRECIVNSGALMLQPIAELLQDLFSHSQQLWLLHNL